MQFYLSLVLVVITAILYLLWKFKSCHAFFVNNGIPFVKPYNLIFGHLISTFLLKKSLMDAYKEHYNKLKPHKFGGVNVFQMPVILIRDPELIKCILVKDFHYFENRGVNIHEEHEPLLNNLFNMKGENWKHMRSKSISTFTSGKMRMMLPLMKNCGDRLREVIQQMDENVAFDAKDLSARLTTDIISTCAFGLEGNSLKNPNSEFRKMGNKFFEFSFAQIVRGIWPNMPKIFIKWFNLKFIEENVQSYFLNIIRNTIKYRETNNIIRKDFLDLMMSMKQNSFSQKIYNNVEMNKDGYEIEKNFVGLDITTETIAAQAFVFFAAGFEPTSTVLSLLIMELALNESIQTKTRNEIEKVLEKNGGDLTYDVLKELTYTDMVIEEALRKYTPAGLILRQCNKTYEIPDTNVVIPEKTAFVIPVVGLHEDPEYYEKPNEFYPEHFSKEAKARRPNFSYLPFGEGPRVCIAERFAKMEIKIGLISMLQGFRYQISPKMRLPVKFKKNFGLLQVDGEVLLTRQRI